MADGKEKERKQMGGNGGGKGGGVCMPLTITFPVFFTLAYVMVKDVEKPLQLLQFFISKKTRKG